MVGALVAVGSRLSDRRSAASCGSTARAVTANVRCSAISGTAAAAFDRMQAGKNLGANQLHFVNLLIDVVVENGLVEVGALWKPYVPCRGTHRPGSPVHPR
ncbi:hypothetical protein GCM10023318_39140 [Nocardia callitridis]|uniref:Uncharacterized protein n=1 Tax=Nocardia callitridis TaxID=648753 RepID=A0ABP9KHJ5_9NOCA